MTPFLFLLGCAACSACFQPNLDDVERDDSDEQEHSEEESGLDSPPDTTPPPPCPQPEEEPNNNSGSAFPIEMESWACGLFESALDFDVYTFEMDEDGWLEVDIDAASRGSAADVILSLESEDGLTAAAYRGDESSDPRIVVPVPAGTWEVWLNELSQDYGGDQDYHLLATVTKRPVSWNRNSEEFETPNNTNADAMVLESGDVVWGVIDASTAFDWYVWQSPNDGEKHLLRVSITAMSEGSPLNPRLQRYDLDAQGEVQSFPTESWDSDPNSASMDPKVELHGTDQDIYMKVRHTPTTQTGELYWYVLSFEVI